MAVIPAKLFADFKQLTVVSPFTHLSTNIKPPSVPTAELRFGPNAQHIARPASTVSIIAFVTPSTFFSSTAHPALIV